VSESNSSPLHQVAPQALSLKGAMGGKARISYACTCKSVSSIVGKRLKKHLTALQLCYALILRGESKVVTSRVAFRYPVGEIKIDFILGQEWS
jgi:hypothetical protein